MSKVRETDLYAPIKSFLEAQGYRVKSEVSRCDVVAVRGDEDPVVVELKTNFSLQLVFQGMQRQTVTDLVYVAVAVPNGGASRTLWGRQYRDIVKLCRMLGLGLIAVHVGDGRKPLVAAHLDPAPYRPRKNKVRRSMLLREFQRRMGDPNEGGGNKRPIVTAYRQDALRCAHYLQRSGASRAVVVKTAAGVPRAPNILLRDVYGWFHRVERGTYVLTPAGSRALDTFSDVVADLTS